MKTIKQPYTAEMLQDLAKQIIRISKTAEQIYIDQLDIVGSLDAQNLFQIDRSTHSIYIINHLFHVKFSEYNDEKIMQIECRNKNLKTQHIEQFILNELIFLTNETESQNVVLVRNLAEKFRLLMCEQLYIWVNGQQRIVQWLQNLSAVQAEIVDHFMIKFGIYKRKIFSKSSVGHIEIPNEVILIFTDLFRLDIVLKDDFLPTRTMVQSFIDLSFSAKMFLPQTHYKIIEILHPESFNLLSYKNSFSEIKILQKHAQQHGNLLAFIKLMKPDCWSKEDVFSKKNFKNNDEKTSNSIWLDYISQPLFNFPKDVSWLFKQDRLVINWIVENIQHSSVKVAVSTFSFIDCSSFHPNIILACLKYFQFSAARMFISSCAYYAEHNHWQAQDKLQHSHKHNELSNYPLKPSILYLDEWLELLAKQAKKEPLIIKSVYSNLSRVMQAFMMHLKQITACFPENLMPYIQPEQQTGRDFIYVLKHHNIQLNDFRQIFYLRQNHVRESIFDAYVRDYLMHYFSENTVISKHVTWLGLFHKAVDWHHEIHKTEIIEKLKSEFSHHVWVSFSRQKTIAYQHWIFEELSNLDRIIEESQRFHHCLASSYAVQIIQGEYVAFHMSSANYNEHLTLGCHLQNGQLYFDQLEYPNNKKAEQVLVNTAKQFIDELNLKQNN